MAGYLQVTWSITANLTRSANFVQLFCPGTLGLGTYGQGRSWKKDFETVMLCV
jgi:hypothetical protein